MGIPGTTIGHVWLTQTEQNLLNKISKEIEEALMFGTSSSSLRRAHATELLMKKYCIKQFDQQEYDTLVSMINSPLEEDLSLAEEILKTR